MNLGIDELIAGLIRPGAYSHSVDRVEVLQTHISILFFAGDVVYKVKKPVDMGFLDYTTLEKRLFYCREEVRLNRRLALETYLGVAAIVRDEAGMLHVDASNVEGNIPGAVDYAVRMQRLPADRMMDVLLNKGEIDNSVFNELASQLADFHSHAATGDGVDQYGEPAELQRQSDETCETVQRFAGNGGAALWSRFRCDHLQRWLTQFLEEHDALLRQRIAEGRIREGHGDLHAGNICVLKTGIVLYDCIEFTSRFRCRDVAGELAMLAMDLDARGYRQFGAYLLRRYATLTGDDELLRVATFYNVYFALVRGMVAALKSVEDEVEVSERAAATREAKRYFQLAALYTIGPALILMCGLPASGKSHVAKRIAAVLEARVLRSDAIRKELAGVRRTEKAPQECYGELFSDRVFEAMRDATAEQLHGRHVVIADATFIERRRRRPFVELARDMHVPMVLVQVECEEDEIRRRMQARSDDSNSVSDADWDVYLSMRDQFEPPVEIDAAQRVVVRSPAGDADVVDPVVERLIRQVG